MEMRSLFKKGKKAQLMTTFVFIMFMLMLAELFAFLILDVNYNGFSQNVYISNGAQNIDYSLSLSAHDFASQSLQRAILTLATYESTPSLRGNNFISNASYYISNIMIMGLLPNATAAAEESLVGQMGAFTLASYNASVLKDFNSSAALVKINETRPYIYQTSPYTISVKYFENVSLNTSSGTYRFAIPVNATINLTGEPDLFYAQQGIMRYITFGNLSGSVSQVGGTYAINGSIYNFAYGTADLLNPGAGCPSFSPQTSNSIILVSQNALGITSSGCENGFAGLITTSNTVSATPQVPYLAYSANVNLQQLIRSGDSILLYGPELSSFSIEKLKNEILNNYYFGSYGTASYINRANGQIGQASPYGIFTFDTQRQGAQFNGNTAQIAITPQPGSNLYVIPQTTGITVSAWIYMNANQLTFATANTYIINTNGALSCPPAGSNGGFGLWFDSQSSMRFADRCSDYLEGNSIVLTPKQWYDVVVTVGKGSNPTEAYYINGQEVYNGISSGWISGSTWTTLYIGSKGGTGYFNGIITNVQIYNTSLPGVQIDNLYSEGIEGIPPTNSGIVGWWPLNGNMNDYSGQGNNGVGSNIVYTTLPSGSPTISPAVFNSLQDSYFEPFNGMPFMENNNNFAVSVWVYPTSANGVILDELGSSTPNVGYHDSMMELVSGTLYVRVWTGSGCVSLGTVPLNRWSNIVLVGSASGSTITYSGYVDGAFVGQGSGTRAPPNPAYYTLGSEDGTNCGSGAAFSGSIADWQFYSSAISSSQVSQLYSEGIAGAPLQDAGITGWWQLNGNADDYSGNGNVGVPVNVVFAQALGTAQDSLLGNDNANLYPLPGILSCNNLYNCYNASLPNIYLSKYPIVSRNYTQVAKFNGKNSNIAVGATDFPTGSAPRSAFAWVYFTGSPSAGITMVYCYGTNLATEQSGLAVNTSAVRFVGDSDHVQTPFTLTPNSWNFIGYSYTSGSTQMTLYLNSQSYTGTLSRSVLNTIIPGSDPSNIGEGCQTNSQPFPGYIADVQAYNTAVTPSQANVLYGEGLGGAPILPGNVIGFWPLNGNIRDYSGLGNDGLSDQNVTFPYMGQNVSNIASFWQATGLGITPR